MLAGTEQGFAFKVEVIALCARLRYRMEWIPIRTIYAGETSHVKVWSHDTGFLRVALRARRVAHLPRGRPR